LQGQAFYYLVPKLQALYQAELEDRHFQTEFENEIKNNTDSVYIIDL
jgi:hypothetical protein